MWENNVRISSVIIMWCEWCNEMTRIMMLKKLNCCVDDGKVVMEFFEKIVYFICWEKVCYPTNGSEKYLYQLLSIVACRIRDISLHVGDVGFLCAKFVSRRSSLTSEQAPLFFVSTFNIKMRTIFVFLGQSHEIRSRFMSQWWLAIQQLRSTLLFFQLICLFLSCYYLWR